MAVAAEVTLVGAVAATSEAEVVDTLAAEEGIPAAVIPEAATPAAAMVAAGITSLTATGIRL